MACSSPISSLPDELLRIIFDFTFPSPSLFDSSHDSLARKKHWLANMRMKQAIVTVCQAWRVVGSEFLYEDVVIHYLAQMERLTGTLQGKGGVRLGALVRRITLDCWRPQTHARAFDLALDAVLHACPVLSAISFHHAVLVTDPGTADTRTVLPLPQAFWARSTNLTHFVYRTESVLNPGSIRGLPAGVLRTLTAVRVLDIHINADWPDRHVVELPQLEDLYLTYPKDYRVQLRGPPDDQSVDGWITRSLKRLTVVMKDDGELSGLIPFLKGNGRSVVMLHFQAKVLDDLSTLLGCCPRLDHLILPLAEHNDHEAPPVRHRTLQYIDMWKTPSDIGCGPSLPFLMRLSPQIPCLRRTRIVDGTLKYMRDLPVLLHPRGWNEDCDVVNHHFPDVNVRESFDRVDREDVFYDFDRLHVDNESLFSDCESDEERESDDEESRPRTDVERKSGPLAGRSAPADVLPANGSEGTSSSDEISENEDDYCTDEDPEGYGRAEDRKLRAIGELLLGAGWV